MLAKEDILNLDRCPRLAWLARHRPELGAAESAINGWTRAQGIDVGEEARRHFPRGRLVEDGDGSPSERARRTRDALAGDAPALFEATFATEDLAARVDILERGADGWGLVEVKANTSVPGPEPETRRLAALDLDLAVQRHVLEGEGLRLDSVELMLLNAEHRHPDRGPLFLRFDRRKATAALQERVRALVAAARSLLRSPEAPDTPLGPQCRDRGNDCAFLSHCRAAAGLDGPESIVELYADRGRSWAALAAGIRTLAELPEDGLDAVQRRQVRVARTRAPEVDRAGLAAALESWTFPLVHLDFESINFARPRIAGLGPWQHVPFQFSVHVETSAEAEPLHHEFLSEERDAPQVALAAALAAVLERWPDRPLVAWYARFERGQLECLARLCPDHAATFEAAIERLIDPLPLTRENVYLPAFRGSFGLKYVAPALLGARASYADLEVGDGGAAVVAWDRLTRSEDPEERRRLRRELLAYCKQDTQVMMDVVRELRRLAAR